MLDTVNDFQKMANRLRDISGSIPIGFKLSANHIEQDCSLRSQKK